MFASLNYINTHHPPSAIEGQPNQHPSLASTSTANTTSTTEPLQQILPNNLKDDDGPTEDKDEQNQRHDLITFQASLKTLSQDLVMKQKQIEILIKSLPGIGNSADDQERKIEELALRLKTTEALRTEARQERDELVRRVGELAMGCKRVY